MRSTTTCTRSTWPPARSSCRTRRRCSYFSPLLPHRPSRSRPPTSSAWAARCATATRTTSRRASDSRISWTTAAKTVVRGGWGVYYTHYSENIPGDLAAGPYAATTVSTNSIVNGQPLFTLANPFAIPGTPGTLALRAVTPNLQNSYAQQYSLSLERETHARPRPARELHRFQGNPAGLSPRRQPAGRLHAAVQQCAPAVPSVRHHQLRR